jgi:Uncharacterised protein family (UPF0236)
VSVCNTHCFSQAVLGKYVSPYLQKLLVSAGVSDVYSAGVDLFAEFLRIDVSASLVYRTSIAVGDLLPETELYMGESDTYAQESVVYAQVDGSMLLTDDGWKEVKVGRVIGNSAIQTLSTNTNTDTNTDTDTDTPSQAPRKVIALSEYCAYLGHHTEFEARFDALLAKIPPKNLVFINDGASWIQQWQLNKYPQATQILDYYHAVEHLAEATREVPKCSDWLATQKNLLIESQVDKVISHVKNLRGIDPVKRDKLVNYYQNNIHRMDYKTYRERGLWIGSGAIEAAHRTLIQQRMKRSGQRWSEAGAQKLLKLRVAYLSKKQALVNQVIRNVA